MSEAKQLSEITEAYYDSKNADEFYHTIWGGEDIHIGIYDSAQMPITTASHQTVKTMAAAIEDLPASSSILDIGAGYGGAARFLARKYGFKVTCLNLSRVENDKNIEKNQQQALDHLVHVVQGNFEDLPFDDEQFDAVWSEDAILHSGNKGKVFAEVARVSKPGARFIFTDPMQQDDCPEGVLQPILDRIHLQQLGSVGLYRQLAAENGLQMEEVHEMPEQLVHHYSAVLSSLEDRESDLVTRGVEQAYIDRMKTGLMHWIEGGKNGYLNWGILRFRK